MDTPAQNERMLLADIETLREQFPQTQDLYREVCIAMFFRYGVTPTANKLYQLVRKGSMSAPAEALNRFWEDLREKSRVRIEHPDLPEALKQATAEMAISLWMTAMGQAQESLTTYRSEVAEQLVEAKAAKEAAEMSEQAANKAMEANLLKLKSTETIIQDLEHRITALQTKNEGLASQLDAGKAEIINYQSQLKERSLEFTLELEKQRQVSQMTEERFNASEKRALMEIDRERQQSGKLQKELDQARSLMAELIKNHQKELLIKHDDIGSLRQEIGSLQGNLSALNESRDLMLKELSSERGRLEILQSHLSSIKTEREEVQKQLHIAADKIISLHAELVAERAARQAEKQLELQIKPTTAAVSEHENAD
ncbi:DNA-binding protein [Undibacterium sp.]|uniref:DNA-binding protein n=1 Tax=Undibacterium sp. TaxID=1914977 RepID=UPI00272F21D7|nr:DNA-binding protein [Undibacterium sp.]MDP1978025.1 DNA-binding protein [Undibacterium sp.]